MKAEIEIEGDFPQAWKGNLSPWLEEKGKGINRAVASSGFVIPRAVTP